MSIHDAFNDIAVEQGGTASTDGTIIGAIDALNDALAGSDQERAKSIEEAIRLLGDNIGGNSGSAFDAEIKVTAPADSADPWVCEIVSGTYAALDAMLQDGIAPSVLVRHFVEGATRGYCSTMTYVKPGEDGGLNVFYMIGFESSGSNLFESYYLLWNDDDTIAKV